MDHPELSFRLRAVPAAIFIDLIREARQPLNARALKRRLEELGVEREAVDAAWRRAQPGVKRHANIAVDAGGTYTWSDLPVPVEVRKLSPVEALERILRGRLQAAVKADFGDLIRAALRERDTLEQQARAAYDGAREARNALERQIRIDAARSVAELAMEVEELAAAPVAPDVLVERVRALAKQFDLSPVGRTGDEVGFDRRWHAPIGGHPTGGTPVIVVRPGYTWRVGERDVLLDKAQVVRRADVSRGDVSGSH